MKSLFTTLFDVVHQNETFDLCECKATPIHKQHEHRKNPIECITFDDEILSLNFLQQNLSNFVQNNGIAVETSLSRNDTTYP